ncbi:MAG: AAA family ATPase [Thermodesulfobacteriota bacterium]
MSPGPNRERSSGRVIAVAGKGGAGKTTLAAILIRLLSSRGLRLLAVDADPPVSLAYALGGEPGRTIGDLRFRLIEDPDEKRRIGDRPMAEVIREELVRPVAGVDLLVLGQAEAAGCFCGLNELLKYGIESLARYYDLTLIDGEAGIEQINRRVINSMDVLVMVSDPTFKGLRTAAHLKNIAGRQGLLERCRTGLVFNRVASEIEALEAAASRAGLTVWGRLPLDENVARYDLVGRPTVDLPDDSPSVAAAGSFLGAILGE